MSRIALSHLLRRFAPGLAAALLASAPQATPDAKPALPAGVTATQQHARWVAAFNGWRSATKSTWREETVIEADLRRGTRLLILPTPIPVLSRQRWLDGRAIVISSGLIALLDEMLLAEAVSDMPDPKASIRALKEAPPRYGCFDTYGARVLSAVGRNRESQAFMSPEPLIMWPRFSTLVEAGKARTIGETYETEEAADRRHKAWKKQVDDARKAGKPAPPEVDATGGPCKSVTKAMLHSGAVQARTAESADALALWLFTQQNLQLARLPSLTPAKASEVKTDAAPAARPGAAAPGADAKTAKAGQKIDAAMQPVNKPADAGSAPVLEPLCAAPPAWMGSAASTPAAAAASPSQRARLAVCATGRAREPRTAEWLARYMPLFDAGSSPTLQP